MKFLKVAIAILFCALSLQAKAQVMQNIATYGAVGDGVTNDAAAFAAAIAAASAPGGGGVVYIPPTSSCFLLSNVNATNLTGIRFTGNGRQSCVMVGAGDSAGNWFDLSGSHDVTFTDLYFVNGSAAPPARVFLWACAGPFCGTSGVLSGLHFDRVNVVAKSTVALLYAYGYGPVGAGSRIGGGSLSCRDSTWKQLNNGPAQSAANIYKSNAVWHLDALNSMAATSAYVSVGTSTATAWRTVLTNCDLVDAPAGFGGGVVDNNSAAVFYNVNQLTMTGGSFQCVCIADTVIWHQNEGLTFIQTAFESPDGGAGSAWYWVYVGGGQNGFLNFISPLWSSPAAGFIAIDAAVSATDGGIQSLKVIGNDVGLNAVPVNFIAKTNSGCGPWPVKSPWISLSNLDFVTNGDSINSCGSIDSHTIFQNVGPIYLPAGATDSSHHF